MQVNSKEYWEERFASGNWTDRGGNNQTRYFAEAQWKHFHLGPRFSGALCDFGCGEGDAFPVYRRALPLARLIGVDFSEAAIIKCRQRYSELAEFVAGDEAAVPDADVVVCSNVIEHLSDDKAVVSRLIPKCRRLFIVVPYREQFLLGEHVRAYDNSSFSDFDVRRMKIFRARGWSFYGRDIVRKLVMDNAIRVLNSQPIVRQRYQILYEIAGGAR